ncbi:MAG TPA: hypothetical protein VHZ78_04390 [Rhizomicrobium sp.]|nr:hypothetical protein [Rhizomicrobium sp.]
MLIRFVIDRRDPDSGRRQGLFQAAKALRDSGLLSAKDDDALEDIWAWFNRHLERPERLALSPRPHAKAQALSWFRDTATNHVAKMREFAGILEQYGITVQTIRTSRPGYVLYKDEYQVAAYPFADTPT